MVETVTPIYILAGYKNWTRYVIIVFAWIDKLSREGWEALDHSEDYI